MSKMIRLSEYVNNTPKSNTFQGERFTLEANDKTGCSIRWDIVITSDYSRESIDLKIYAPGKEISDTCAHLTIDKTRAIELRDFFGDLVKLFEKRGV